MAAWVFSTLCYIGQRVVGGFRDTLLNKTYLNGYFLLILYIECNSVYGGTAKALDKAV